MSASPSARSSSYWWYVPMLIGSLAMVFPLWWMLALSLETEQRAGAALASGSPFDALPTDPQFGNYAQAMQEVGTIPWLGFIDALSLSLIHI